MEQVTGEAWNFLCGKILNYGVGQSGLIRKHPPWEWQPRANILSSFFVTASGRGQELNIY